MRAMRFGKTRRCAYCGTVLYVPRVRICERCRLEARERYRQTPKRRRWRLYGLERMGIRVSEMTRRRMMGEFADAERVFCQQDPPTA